MKHLIFDFDGVIVDSFEFHRTSIEKYSGIVISEGEYQDMHDGNFFNHGKSELKTIDWGGYDNFIMNGYSNLSISDTIKQQLALLSDQYKLHIVSSAHDSLIESVLAKNSLIDYFDEIYGSSVHKSKIVKFEIIFNKHELNPCDCIFVTDTLGDLLEAKKYPMKTVAVDFGFHDRERLEKGNPDVIISDFGELLDVINVI